MFGTAVGLVTGFMTGLSTNADDRLALGQDARRVIHDDLVAALTVGLIFGLPSALLVALTDWRIYGFIVGLTPGSRSGPWSRSWSGSRRGGMRLPRSCSLSPRSFQPDLFNSWSGPATPGSCASPASPTSADTTPTSSGWPQAMLVEVSRRHLMRKPADDLATWRSLRHRCGADVVRSLVSASSYSYLAAITLVRDTGIEPVDALCRAGR